MAASHPPHSFIFIAILGFTMPYDIHIPIFLCLLAVIAVLLIWQNHAFLRSADKRLSKANDMVLTLAHSADNLAESIQHLKDMMVHLEQVYTSRNDAVIKSRDEITGAYKALLHRYTDLETKYENVMKDAHATLAEIARRPTTTNNNNSTNLID